MCAEGYLLIKYSWKTIISFHTYIGASVYQSWSNIFINLSIANWLPAENTTRVLRYLRIGLAYRLRHLTQVNSYISLILNHFYCTKCLYSSMFFLPTMSVKEYVGRLALRTILLRFNSSQLRWQCVCSVGHVSVKSHGAYTQIRMDKLGTSHQICINKFTRCSVCRLSVI